MKPMTNELREKIRTYIKNKLDISDLIKDVDIKGEDLSYAIIKNFDRVNDDISGCNFTSCIIGEKDKVTNLSGTIMRNCSFKDAKFLGKVYMRKVDAQGSTFRDCYMPYAEIQYSNFKNCCVCGWILPFSGRGFLKTKWSKEVIDYIPLPILFQDDKIFKVATFE